MVAMERGFSAARQAESVFYRQARFYSVSEVEKLLADTGFVDFVWVQTLSKPLHKIQEIEPLCDGHERGGFVVVKAVRG
jgi:hypothetical protein